MKMYRTESKKGWAVMSGTINRKGRKGRGKIKGGRREARRREAR